MGHYQSNVRDLEFNLLEVLRIQERLGRAPFAEVTEADVRAVLAELDALATGVVADSFAEGDRDPAVFDPERGDARIPAAVKDAVAALVAGGWDRTGLRTDLGGYGLPSAAYWAGAELILGANPVVYIYSLGKLTAQLLHDNGTAEQRRWARTAIERDWSATMVLTEPDAGSDVGAGRTTAIRQPDGSWHLDGVKRFITAAAQDDMTENILHLVLARPQGPGVADQPGTKGLGLFIVPKHHFDPHTGALTGEQNGVVVTGMEHKMGIRASTTCELSLGRHGTPAKGWLVGERVAGIAQMFDLITTARMMVGVKAAGTLSTGYLNALGYARQRVQGADLSRMLDKSAPRVPILRHPDVRRSLMRQKAYAEGLRALCLYTASLRDASMANPDDEVDAALAGLLLPIVKGAGSERGWALLAESLQVFGGAGYLRDHPMEQYLRDAKIDSLYEGTTGIQSLDFFFRGIVRDGGKRFETLAERISADCTAGDGDPLAGVRAALGRGLADVRAMVDAMVGRVGAALTEPTEVYKAGQHTVALLIAAGDLLVGWRLLAGAQVADRALRGDAPDRDRPFYAGKIAVARFFAATVLPTLAAQREIVVAADNMVMELDDAAF